MANIYETHAIEHRAAVMGNRTVKFGYALAHLGINRPDEVGSAEVIRQLEWLLQGTASLDTQGERHNGCPVADVCRSAVDKGGGTHVADEVDLRSIRTAELTCAIMDADPQQLPAVSDPDCRWP